MVWEQNSCLPLNMTNTIPSVKTVWQCVSMISLLLVQNRRQTRDQVLSVHLGSEASAGSAPVGSTTVLEEHANDQWLDIIQGTPAFTGCYSLSLHLCLRRVNQTPAPRAKVIGTPVPGS